MSSWGNQTKGNKETLLDASLKRSSLQLMSIVKMNENRKFQYLHTAFHLFCRRLCLRGLTVHTFGDTNLEDYSYVCYLWPSWNTSVCPWGCRNDTVPRLSTPGVSADSNRPPWRILPLQLLYFMTFLFFGWVPELCVGQATETRLEEDTWFAEPKGFMRYLVLSSSVPWRWKWVMSTGISRDLDRQQTPLTGT